MAVHILIPYGKNDGVPDFVYQNGFPTGKIQESVLITSKWIYGNNISQQIATIIRIRN